MTSAFSVIPSRAKDRFSINVRRSLFIAATTLTAIACGSDNPTQTVAPGFLGGTSNNHEIGLAVSSLGRTLTLFQLGSPTIQKVIALGASPTIDPVGFSIRARRAAVPLGDAASVALIDLETQTALRFFTFASGNATGSAFADDTTIIATNILLNVVGRFTTGQPADAIGLTTKVAPFPTDVVIAGTRALIVSSNLDANYQSIGKGIVTAVDTKTLQVLGTATMGGNNSQAAALGPDGLLYVVNTGDYVSPGSLTIVDPLTMQVVTTISGIEVGAGSITIDSNGLAYISSYSDGTVVWDTKTRTFVRGPSNPVCAKLASGACRGATSATANAAGDVYQGFAGDPTHAPYIFVYKAGTFALTDSIAVSRDPLGVLIRKF